MHSEAGWASPIRSQPQSVLSRTEIWSRQRLDGSDSYAKLHDNLGREPEPKPLCIQGWSWASPVMSQPLSVPLRTEIWGWQLTDGSEPYAKPHHDT